MLSAYPTSAYLIRGATPRLRVLDERGRPDAAAIRMTAMLLPAVDIDDATRAAAQKAIARYDALSAERFVAKDAVGFGDMQDAGLLREVGGLTVFVENPKGSTRTGKKPDGTAWSTEMACDYGFFPQTMSVDGEEIDAYVGPDSTAPIAYVISQVREDGTFDEPKVMLGFASELEAVRAFLAHCPGWCFGGVTPIHVAFLAGMMNIEPTTVSRTLKSTAALSVRKADAVEVVAVTTGEAHVTLRKTLLALQYQGLVGAGTEVILEDGGGRHHVAYFDGDGPSKITEIRIGREILPKPDETSLGELVQKADVSTAAIGAGGKALPTQEPKLDEIDIEGAKAAAKEARVQKTAKALDQVKGWWASTSHIGQALTLDEAPPTIARAVSEMPLTEKYPNPDDVGGWLGVIEPDDGLWIAFVAMDGRTLIWTEREPDGGVIGMPYYTYRLDLAQMPIADAIMKGFRPIMKFRVQVLGPSTDNYVPIQKDAVGPQPPAKPKRRIVYGVVLEPHPCDGQGDSQGHTYGPDFVRDACHYYSQFRLINLDHKGPPVDPARARVVEIFIAPVDFTLDTPRGPQPVKKGAWVMGTEILDEELWARVERGDWQAYSIEGFSRSIAIESAHWNTRQMQCVHCSAAWRAAVAKDRPFPSTLECPRCHKPNSSALS